MLERLKQADRAFKVVKKILAQKRLTSVMWVGWQLGRPEYLDKKRVAWDHILRSQ